MQRFIPICMMILVSSVAEARMWTDTAGKAFEAKAVWVNSDRNVKLKISPKEIIIVPFSTFVEKDIEHLEYLLSRKGRGKLHRVSWSKMNALFGLDIWRDDYLWDDTTGLAAERMHLQKESKTDFIENHRAYPLGADCVLREPVYTTILYGGEEHVESLSFVFLNQGDITLPERLSQRFIESMNQKIETSGMHVHDTIVPILGKPKRDTIGRGNMREKVWRWDWNDHAIMLIMQEGKYAMLRILPSKLADRSGRVEKIKGSDLRKRMASCVKQRDNGDVIIHNIPMVDQGPKGYCSPATWERYLRYLGIPANMYQLAIVGQTGIGGGTYARDMIAATKGLLSKNGRRLEELGRNIDVETIVEYIVV